MKCIALFFILVSIVNAELRASCLKANDICRGSDFSVEEFILCGEQPKQNFSIDSSIIAPKGSGFMRKPDQCDGICVDIMTKTDRNKLKCNNAFNVPLWNCSNYKNAKQCVPDIGGWIGIAGGVIVIMTVVGCWISNKKHSEDCQDEMAAEAAAKAAAKAAKKKEALDALRMKPMKMGQVPNYYP
jgi:hypothetical protein